MLGLSLKLSCVETFLGVKRQLLCQFGRLTPILVPVPVFYARILELTWNACLGHQISGKVWTIIHCWKAQDVYFQTQLRAHQLGFCSYRKFTLSAGRSESNSIYSPFSAFESDFCSGPSISARKYLKSQKNTKTHSKVQKCDF